MSKTGSAPTFLSVGSQHVHKYRIVAERTVTTEKEAVSSEETPHAAYMAAINSGALPFNYKIKFVENPGVDVWEVVGSCEGCRAPRFESESGITQEGWVSDDEGCETCPKCHAAILLDLRRTKISRWVGGSAGEGVCEMEECVRGGARTRPLSCVLVTMLGKFEGYRDKEVGIGTVKACRFCIDDFRVEKS